MVGGHARHHRAATARLPLRRAAAGRVHPGAVVGVIVVGAVFTVVQV